MVTRLLVIAQHHSTDLFSVAIPGAAGFVARGAKTRTYYHPYLGAMFSRQAGYGLNHPTEAGLIITLGMVNSRVWVNYQPSINQPMVG